MICWLFPRCWTELRRAVTATVPTSGRTGAGEVHRREISIRDGAKSAKKKYIIPHRSAHAVLGARSGQGALNESTERGPDDVHGCNRHMRYDTGRQNAAAH